MAPSIRPPAVAGLFYPSHPRELVTLISDLLTAARADPEYAPAAAAHAVVAPHAGYIYSGPTAAAVFARIKIPSTVVIVAPNHTGVLETAGGASLWERGAFRTPLGDVPIADAWAERLLQKSRLVGVDHAAHRAEHAVEVELPFLQYLRPDVRIVPLVLAWDDWESCRALGTALAELIRDGTEPVLLVASSDLNHYEAAAISEQKDARALEAVAALDGAELLARCRREHITMCGRAATATVLAAAKALGADRAHVVDYRHSGVASGDDTRVVGYGGVVI